MENSCTNPVSCREKMRARLRSHWPALLGIVIGAGGGFLYYRLVGCSSGGCPITSNPWITMLWGAGLGYLLGDMFKIKPSKTNENEKEYGND
jgi:hypothetical protein